jgi:ABC-type multidrug transport system ATPase subunit
MQISKNIAPPKIIWSWQPANAAGRYPALSNGQWRINKMTEEEALHLIKTTPALLSILYNCGALPEQQVASIPGAATRQHQLLAYAHAYQAGVKTEQKRCAQECERLRTGHDRYEYVRKLSTGKFQEVWATSVHTGQRFDEIIDELRGQK